MRRIWVKPHQRKGHWRNQRQSKKKSSSVGSRIFLFACFGILAVFILYYILYLISRISVQVFYEFFGVISLVLVLFVAFKIYRFQRRRQIVRESQVQPVQIQYQHQPMQQPMAYQGSNKTMSKSEGAGKYQVHNDKTAQGLVIGDNPTVYQHFHGSSAPPDPQEQLFIGREDKEMQKIKALFLAASPSNTSRLAIDEEMHAIEQKFRAAEHRDALVFQSAWAVRPDDLLQLLNQHQPHIVHFSGHGRSEGLSLAGDNEQERLITTQALKLLFTTLKDNIRLVFLNACYSREQALALVETIDCVIGMKESVYDDAAIVFASSFYRAVGFGRSLQGAFEQGITSLLLEGIPQEDIPELLVKKGVDAKKVLLIAPANP